jgi:nicotinamidase-related amidase
MDATDPQFDSAALIVIDTQHDVLDDGAFPIAGTSDALPRMRRVLEAFRAARLPIVHVVRIYEPDGSNAELCRRELLAAGAEIVLRDSAGSQIASELLPQPDLTLDAQLLLAGRVQPLGPGEVAIYKPRWGAFYGTRLEEHLRGRGVTTVAFMGCNFPNCPRTSIYEASERDFRIVVVRDAVSGLYDRGAEELAGIGVRLIDANELAAALEPLASTVGR